MAPRRPRMRTTSTSPPEPATPADSLGDLTVVWFDEAANELGVRDKTLWEPPSRGFRLTRARPVPVGAGMYRIETPVRRQEQPAETPALGDLLADLGPGELADTLAEHVAPGTLKEARHRLDVAEGTGTLVKKARAGDRAGAQRDPVSAREAAG